MPIGSDKGNFIKPGFDPLAVQTTETVFSLFSWGFNSNGQLGLGDTVDRSSPVQVGATNAWAQVSNGAASSLAVTPVVFSATYFTPISKSADLYWRVIGSGVAIA